MKKLLLSFLPVLLALTAFTAKAQTFTATVTWDTPGTIKVLKGSNPAYGTEVEVGNATSYTVTEKADYMFIPTEGNFIESAMMDDTALKLSKNYNDGGYYFKLEAEWNSSTYNGKTVELTTKAYVYDGQFTLTIDNGADKINFQLQDQNGSLTRKFTPTNGDNTIKLTKDDAKLYMQGTSFPSPEFNTATINDQNITSTYGRYTTDVKNGDKVYIALDAPGTVTQDCKVTFVYANNNPDCLSNIYNSSTGKFIMPADLTASNNILTLESGTKIKINLVEDAGFTFKSITANPSTAVTVDGGNDILNHTQFTINNDVTLTIDVTSVTFDNVNATLYTNDINGVTFIEKIGDQTALTTTEGGTHEANTLGTVFPTGVTIDIPTTEYTINDISGKDKRFFFEAKSGYWVKDAIVANRTQQPGDPKDYYRLTGSLVLTDECPLFLNVHKIDYTTPAVIYYEGTADCTTNVTASTPDGETAPYKDQLSTLPIGYSKIMFDPEYNATFSARFMVSSETATGNYYVYADGKSVPASTDSEAVFSGIKLNKNSVLKLFYATAAPKTHTLKFTVEEGATATVTYDEVITTSDFSNSITNVGTVEYTFAPGEDTEILVNDQALQAPYKFTPTAGTNEIKIAKKVNLPTFDFTVKPEDGTTVKTLSKVTLTFGSELMYPNIPDNYADFIKIEKSGTIYPIEGFEEPTLDDQTGALSLAFTLAEAATEAGEYTITLSEGIVFALNEEGVRLANSKAKTFKVTVDPTYQYKWSFDPENGSENNPITEEYVDIKISLPEADKISNFQFDEEAPYVGPWLTYNGNPLTRIDDEGNGDWEVLDDWENYGHALRISINASVFTTPGELTIMADEGAFTVNDNEPSPAIEYSASFGEKKEYTVTLTPAAGAEVKAEEIRTITVTFKEASTVALNEDYFYGVFRNANSAIQLNSDNVSIESNKITITLPESYDVAPGDASLLLDENSFLLDGNQNSPAVEAKWTVARTTSVSFEYTASPSTAVVNEGYGMNVALIFGEYETVTVANQSVITVEFNGEKLGALNYDDLTKRGYSMQAGSIDYPNALMFTAAGGDLESKDTEGVLKVTIPAGAIKVSGLENPDEITQTWNLVKAKEYTVKVTPANGETVASIAKVTIEFTNADKAELYNLPKISLIGSGYTYFASASSVEPIGTAEHPTFEVFFANPATDAGTYTFQMSRGAFTLDDVQESPAVEAVITVDPSFQGISDVLGDAANGKFTVINLQGIVLMKDASAEDLKTLSTGIYIINGKKIAIK